MKKLIFGIFAHPDDESFGPSGTLLTEVEAGNDIHLITLTAGEAGTNPDNLDNLAEVRLDEWRKAGELIGATSMHHLGYHDGQLDNADLQQASQTIIDLVSQISQDTAETHQIEFITNDLNGISGHIDHIVAARATCLAFYRLRDQGLPMKRIRLSCVTRQALPVANTKWLYMEPGRSDDEIDEIVDASDHYEQIIQIIRAHYTQRGDGESHIERRGQRLALNYFMILD